MYILKNAFRNITRAKGRNALIGLIITSVTIAACITITINKSGNALVDNYKNNNPLEVSLNLDPMSFRNASDEDKEDFKLLDVDTIEEIGTIDVVNDFYYSLQAGLNSDQLNKVSYEELYKRPDENSENTPPEDTELHRGGGNGGFMSGSSASTDYQVIAYSDISYYEDFVNETKKIKEGKMISVDSKDDEIVISEELALDNELSVGDIITFKDVNNEEVTYDLKVIGIYENTETENIMLTGGSNTIITNLTVVNKIKENDTNTSEFGNSSSINAVFYMKSEDIKEFEEAVRFMGVSSFYQINNNEEEVLANLKPIVNITSFSSTFLIVVLVVGAVILTIINLFNIRERKYEIGVLRAIGMTKAKVTLGLVSEMLMVAIISLIIGTSAGVLLTQPVSNNMLKSEIESVQNEQQNVEENFGGSKDFNRGAFNGNKRFRANQNVDYVDSLKVSFDYMTILQLFGVSILLTMISGTVAVMYVNKYEPNKILQNRN